MLEEDVVAVVMTEVLDLVEPLNTLPVMSVLFPVEVLGGFAVVVAVVEAFDKEVEVVEGTLSVLVVVDAMVVDVVMRLDPMSSELAQTRTPVSPVLKHFPTGDGPSRSRPPYVWFFCKFFACPSCKLCAVTGSWKPMLVKSEIHVLPDG